MESQAAPAQGGFDHLRENSIGLPQVLFQSITHMAPGAAIAFSILFSIGFAGPGTAALGPARARRVHARRDLDRPAREEGPVGRRALRLRDRGARADTRLLRRRGLPVLRAARRAAALPDLRVGDDRRVPRGRGVGLDRPVVDLGPARRGHRVLPDLPRRAPLDERRRPARDLRGRRLPRARDLDAPVERHPERGPRPDERGGRDLQRDLQGDGVRDPRVHRVRGGGAAWARKRDGRGGRSRAPSSARASRSGSSTSCARSPGWQARASTTSRRRRRSRRTRGGTSARSSGAPAGS